MKSAFELAMERLGGNLRDYSEEQKEQLAEVDREYDARIAQVHMSAKQRLAMAAADPEKQEEIREGLATEIAGYQQRREAAKEKLRKRFDQGE
jgi:hypothetical protein